MKKIILTPMKGKAGITVEADPKRYHPEKRTYMEPWEPILQRIRAGDSPENARLAARCRAGLYREQEQVLSLIITAA